LLWSEDEHRTETRRVIAEVAHELNRPLAAVLNYAELALLDPDLSDAVRARLEMVVAHAEACRDVIRRSLEIGTAAENPEPVDLNRAVRRAVASLAHVIEQRRVDLSLDLAPELPPVSGSLLDLETVVRNLLENALDAAGPASGSPSVSLATEAAETTVRLTVRDNGPGLDPSVADRLFEPFVTTKDTGQGAGLGLAIVRRIVNEHGGRVTATSPPSGGALFTVDLPPVARAASPVNAVPNVPRAASPVNAVPSHPPRALLVDDDASMRKLLGAFLETLGYEWAEAEDGREGLDRALAEEYDVIICDVKMPNMDGLAFHNALRQAVPSRAARLIFSTGVVSGDSSDPQLRALPNPRLHKPYRLASLKAALAAVGN